MSSSPQPQKELAPWQLFVILAMIIIAIYGMMLWLKQNQQTATTVAHPQETVSAYREL